MLYGIMRRIVVGFLSVAQSCKYSMIVVMASVISWELMAG